MPLWTSRRGARASLVCAALGWAACAAPTREPVAQPTTEPSHAGTSPHPSAKNASLADSVTPTGPAGASASTAAICPPDMVHVKKEFCPDLEHRCVRSEYDKANHITICHRFDTDYKRCRGARIALDFCIDQFEYPNREGAHPPVMVNWHEAKGLCASHDKRLCYESEWTAACEGPDEKPFPYGFERSKERCNIDNRWISPSLARVYSRDPSIRDAELARLDQSKPSGAMPGCVSEYDAYDLTGNFDEWVMADRDRPKARGRLAALKGGAWGHVRNACRPVTTSHEPEFTYYFVSLRCCRDVTHEAHEGKSSLDTG